MPYDYHDKFGAHEGRFSLNDHLKERQLKGGFTEREEERPGGDGQRTDVMAVARERLHTAIHARYREIYSAGGGVNQDRLLETITEVLQPDESLSFGMKEELRQEIVSNVRGVGPILAPFLDDPEVTEVRVVQGREILVSRYGRGGYEATPESTWFGGDDETLNTIIHIFQHQGRSITTERPQRTTKLDDGSRVYAVIPPAALHPTLVIRRPPDPRRTVDRRQLVEWGALTDAMAEFLEAMARWKLNILVTGPMNAGKTTLIRLWGRGIPEEEMVCTVEDTLEINLQRNRVDQLEAVMTVGEGSTPVTLHDLFVVALRGSYDRVVLGEARENIEGGDFIQVCFGGQGGNCTSIHANDAVGVILRLAVMLAGAFNMSLELAVGLATEAVDVIVHAFYYPDGSRKVRQISCVSGVAHSPAEVPGVITPLFEFSPSGRDADGRIRGEHRQVGVLPERVVRRIRERGYEPPPGLLERRG